jgi:AraC family transcriptional regulator
MYLQGDREGRYFLDDLWTLNFWRCEARLRIAGRWLPIEPGGATLVAPRVPMLFRFPPVGQQVWVHLSAGDPDAGAGQMEDSYKVLIPAAQPLGDRFEPMALALEEAVGWLATSPRRVAARVRDLLWQLSDGANRPRLAGPMRQEVAAAMQWIERRLADPIRVPQIAKAVGMSHNHLLRLFREATGQTLAGYICRRRAQRAKHLLERTTMPIKTIAATVGIADLQAFNKTIRRTFDRSPTAIRRGRVVPDML